MSSDLIRVCPIIPEGYMARDQWIERTAEDGAPYLEQVVSPLTEAELAERLQARRPALTVTAVQARLALAEAGMLEALAAWVAGQPSATQIRWEYGATLTRLDPLVTQAATALGLGEEQLDALFAAAAQH